MKKLLALLILMIVLVITGCSNDKDVDEGQGNTDEKPKQEKQIYPYTGIETTDEVNNRAVAVMINNHPASRPHAGLSKADIVFELLAEGDVTRYLALFQSEQPDRVGSVRSARQYYFELAEGYDALYVYHGAANFVNDMIKSRNIDYLNGAFFDNDDVLFKRESFRKAPHNSFLLFDGVYDEAENQGYDIEHDYESLTFLDDDAVIDGEKVGQFTIDYGAYTSQVRYTYNEELESYTRANGDDDTVELDTDEAIELDNVFVIETHHEVFDSEGRRKIDIESGGDALLFQKGHLQRVEWKNEKGRIVAVKDGKVIGFVKGKTWINVIPTNPGLEESVTFE